MNTFFLKKKQNHKLSTFVSPSNTRRGPPLRDRYDMIDYFLTTNRWKNSVKNVGNDANADIEAEI